MEQLRGAELSEGYRVVQPAVHTEYDRSMSIPPALLPSRNSSEKRGARRRGNALDQHFERVVRRTRLIVRILSLLFTASIMIILGYTVTKYLKTQHISATDDHSGFEIRVWPSNLKSQPTLVLLGVSTAATFLNLVLCVANFSSIVSAFSNNVPLFHSPTTPP